MTISEEASDAETQNVHVVAAWPIWAGGYPSVQKVLDATLTDRDGIKETFESWIRSRLGPQSRVTAVSIRPGGFQPLWTRETAGAANSVEVVISFRTPSRLQCEAKQIWRDIGQEAKQVVEAHLRHWWSKGANIIELKAYREELRETDGNANQPPEAIQAAPAMNMTDSEYESFLRALASRYIRLPPALTPAVLRQELERLSSCVHALKAAEKNEAKPFLESLMAELEHNPVRLTERFMGDTGILDALDEAPAIVFGQFRASAIPPDEAEFLRRAGFTNEEADLMLVRALHDARRLASAGSSLPSQVVDEAASALDHARRVKTKPASETSRHAPFEGGPTTAVGKKRKILNGIGKILGGAVGATGNIMLATGTIAAPNPATAYAAIASCGIAVSTLLGGIGDLRGE